MNNLMNLNEERKFTSREVAEWTSKRHDNVMADIRSEIEKLKIGNMEEFADLNFKLGSLKDNNNQERPVYFLTKLGVQQLAMKYDAVVRAKIGLKLQEIEKNKIQIPQTLQEALRLAADALDREQLALEQKKLLEIQNQELQPKADSFDTFISAQNNQTMGDTAKVLGIGRNKLFAFLRESSILMGDNVPYQRYCDAEYFVVKETTLSIGAYIKNQVQTFVTPKGVDYIKKLLDKRNKDI